MTSGHSGQAASLGEIVGPSFSRAEVTQAIATILDTYTALRIEDEPFLHCYRRIGIAPFKEKVYANADKKWSRGHR